MFFKTINLIKINTKLKKTKFFLKICKKEIPLLQIFININVIKYIQFKKQVNNVYYIMVYLNNQNFNKFKLTNKFKPTNKFKLTNKNLKKMNFQKEKISLISTSNGIVTNLNAINKNIGGVLICTIELNN